MVITNYNLTFDQAKAQQLYAELGDQAESTLAKVEAEPGFLNQKQINLFITAVNAKPVAPAAPAAGEQNSQAAEKGGNPLLTLGLVLLGLLVVGAGVVYFFFYSNRVKTNASNLDNIRPAAVPASGPYKHRPCQRLPPNGSSSGESGGCRALCHKSFNSICASCKNAKWPQCSRR